ncbi:MAG: hypothetical protein L6R42_005525 [Xanthoria sp. 1 TBL-2021]|nr:MAG: hypothetical protein L6R42_005525 [Xanthoria sp. 1 TBL-2021]
MDGVSIAASLVGIGTAGCQIAIKLYTLASQISTASQRISSVSNDISQTSGVLKELGEFIKRETATGGTSICSQSGLETTKNSATICESIFSEIERAAKDASEQLKTRDRIVGKIKLSKSEKAKWPFLQPSIESLRIDLREAKGTLMLMLQLMNLRASQRMAAIHHTTATSVVEQREIYRAILAIQKQLQGNMSSRAKRLSIDGSSQGTPRVVAPPPQAYEVTAVSPSLAGQARALDSPPALMALPDPSVLKLEATNMNPSSGSEDTIDEARRDGMNSNSNRSSPGGKNTPQLNARVDNQREQRKVLDYFVTKPIIQEDTRRLGAISLGFWNTKIPMQQVDIRKKLFCSKEEGLLPVLDAYLELRDHERLIIDNLTENVKSHTSLMLLKRTYADISYGGILFKGVPELQFIMERRMNENQNKSGDEAISETTSKGRYKAAREAEIDVAREAAARAVCEVVIIDHDSPGMPPIPPTPSPPKSSEHDSDEERGSQIRHHGAPPPFWDESRHTSADRSNKRRGRQLELGDIVSGSFSPHQGSVNLAERKRKEVVEPEDVLGEGKQSDDSDESSIMSDDAMNDEEAEKAVKELLEKYTTLGTVVGEVSESG